MVEVAYDENLSDFCLKSNHFLEIPELQREFVWEEKNVKTLLRDMKFHQINSDDLGEMFLGPIIIHYKKTTHHDYDGVIPKYRELIDPTKMKNLEIKKIGEKLFPNEVEDCTRKELVEKIENVRKRSELIDGQQRLTILTILSRVLYSKFEENSDIAIALKEVYTHTSGELRLRHKHQADGQDYKNIFQHHDDWVQKKQRAESIFNESKEKVGNLLELIELDKNELEELQKEKEAHAEAAETAATDARQAADDAHAAGDPDAANLEDDAEAAEADAERARKLADEANKATDFAEKAFSTTEDVSKDLERIKITTKRRTDPIKSRKKAEHAKNRYVFWSVREESAREAVDNNTDPIEDDQLRGIHTVIASACKLAEKAAAATEATAVAAEAAEEAAIKWTSGKQEWPVSKEDNYFRLAYDVINEWVDSTDNADAREIAEAALRDAKIAGVEATNARQAADDAQAAGDPHADDLVEAANTAMAARNDAETNAEQAVEIAEKAQLEELENFSRTMLEIIELVTIQISNAKQVHLAFRSLNSLGKVLTDAEKVKNELFSLATLGGDDTGTKNNWNRLVQALKPLTDRNRNAKNDFLFVYCRSKGITHPPSRNTSKSKLSKQDVHAVFADPKGLYDTSCHDEEDGLLVPNSDKVSEFTSELANHAEGYYKMRNPEVLIGSPYKVKADQVNEIVDLSNIFTAQLRPYFLAAFMETIGQKEILELDPNPQKTRMTKERTHFKRLIRAISTAAVRVAICNKKETFRFEQDINRWVGYIAKNPINTAIANIEGEVKALINKHWADDGPETEIGTTAWVNTVDNEFANYLSDELILENKSGKGPDISRAKYLIRGCEGVRSWSTSKQLIQEYYSTDVYTVEHILPKSVVSRWGSDPADEKEGPWGQEWEELDRALPDTRRAWPVSKKEMESLRFRLGNHLLLESRVNSKASTKTWAGRPNRLPLTNTAPGEPFAQWGKYHVYWSLEWWETDELEEEGDDAEKKTGSHLRGVKEFCDEHRGENRWTKELLEKRGKGLAEKAKKKKEWKLW